MQYSVGVKYVRYSGLGVELYVLSRQSVAGRGTLLCPKAVSQYLRHHPACIMHEIGHWRRHDGSVVSPACGYWFGLEILSCI
jgi:hypothetical protein